MSRRGPLPARARARTALAAALALAALAPAAAAEQRLDWCAPIAVRPDQTWDGWKTCNPAWTRREIATDADYVYLSAEGIVASPKREPHPMTCWGPATWEKMREFVDEVNAMRPEGRRPLRWLASMRFDLVFDTFAAQPGFRPEFVVRTSTPFGQVKDFFRREGKGCPGGGCTWSDAWVGKGECAGQCLKDYLDAAGGPGTHERVVYYVNTREHPVYWPSAALARLDLPAYRQWMLGEARSAISLGGATHVVLNHKLFQWHPGMKGRGHWLGGADAPDVAKLRATGDAFSAPPDGYGYAQYVAGWHALAREMDAAAVPFAVHLGRSMFTQPRLYDDPATPDVDEAARVREVGEKWADLVLLEIEGNRAGGEAVAQGLRAKGREVLVVDQGCGARKPGGR